MTRRTAYGLLAFSLLGLLASLGSAWIHYRLLRDPGYASFCDVNTTWSCTSVYESRYGAVRGVPVAVGGVIFFAAATLLALGGLKAPPPAPPLPAPRGGKGARQPPRPAVASTSQVAAPLFALSIVGLAVVLYLAYTSFFVLKTACILCLTTYVAVVGLFILSATATDITTMRALPGRALRDLRLLVSRPVPLVTAMLFIAGAASAVAFFPRQAEPAGTAGTAAAAQQPQVNSSEFERWYTQQPRLPIPVADDGAKVVVIKFNDYLCPPCRQTYMEYKPILAKWQASHPGAVKFVTKDFPLDPECNVNTPGGQHLAACEAAAAVRMARDRGRGEALEEWLFDNQPSMTPAMVREGAKNVGKVPDFEERFPRVLELVKGDIALGAQLGVHATPTFFINGVRIPGLRAEFFDAAIRYELKQAGVLK
jgi:uncharacterized membrane protein/protein-disulfide isomerase